MVLGGGHKYVLHLKKKMEHQDQKMGPIASLFGRCFFGVAGCFAGRLKQFLRSFGKRAQYFYDGFYGRQ